MKTTGFFAPITLLVAGLGGLPPTTHAADVSALGEPLSGEIIGMFVPPTRSDLPWAATINHAYHWDGQSDTWKQRYQPPWTDARIAGLCGYAKSSKVMYVAHDGGIARTSDGGDSWSEAIPSGFGLERGPFVDLVVDPHERRHAVVAYAHHLWETTDYGRTYQPLELDEKSGSIVGAAFLPRESAEPPALLVATEQALCHYEGEALLPNGQWSPPGPIQAFHVHATEPVAFLDLGLRGWRLLRIGPGDAVQLHAVNGPTSGGRLVPSFAGSNRLWIARPGRLGIATLDEATSDETLLAPIEGTPSLLMAHPSDPGSAYFATGDRVWRVSEGFADLSADFLQAPRLNRWQTGAWQRESPRSPTAPESTEQPMDVAAALQQIIQGEPPVSRLVEAVLVLEAHDPEAFGHWRTQARKRHWLPELRLEAGMRKYPVDQSILINSIDRYGIENTDDFRLSDRIQNLGWMGFVLEWDLERAVFDEDQIDVSRERRAAFEQRREIVEEVTELYYLRIAALAEIRGVLGPVSTARQFRMRLQFHQLTDLLNGYCGQPILQNTPAE